VIGAGACRHCSGSRRRRRALRRNRRTVRARFDRASSCRAARGRRRRRILPPARGCTGDDDRRAGAYVRGETETAQRRRSARGRYRAETPWAPASCRRGGPKMGAVLRKLSVGRWCRCARFRAAASRYRTLSVACVILPTNFCYRLPFPSLGEGDAIGRILSRESR
jgi:hypothetical protein